MTRMYPDDTTPRVLRRRLADYLVVDTTLRRSSRLSRAIHWVGCRAVGHQEANHVDTDRWVRCTYCHKRLRFDLDPHELTEAEIREIASFMCADADPMVVWVLAGQALGERFTSPIGAFRAYWFAPPATAGAPAGTAPTTTQG